MDFKAAAREVFEEGGHSLHYTDITEIALQSGYLKSAGRTPQNTMRARLSVDVRDNSSTPFAQTAPGVYGLKQADTQKAQSEGQGPEALPTSEGVSLSVLTSEAEAC